MCIFTCFFVVEIHIQQIIYLLTNYVLPKIHKEYMSLWPRYWNSPKTELFNFLWRLLPRILRKVPCTSKSSVQNSAFCESPSAYNNQYQRQISELPQPIQCDNKRALSIIRDKGDEICLFTSFQVKDIFYAQDGWVRLHLWW